MIRHHLSALVASACILVAPSPPVAPLHPTIHLIMPVTPQVQNCAGRSVMPEHLAFSCGQRPGMQWSDPADLTWTSWDGTEAVTVVQGWSFNVCDPTCARSSIVATQASVRLSDVQDGYYTEATFTFEDLPKSMREAGFTNPFSEPLG